MHADHVMGAVRELNPDLFAFAPLLGDAKAVEHGWMTPPNDVSPEVLAVVHEAMKPFRVAAAEAEELLNKHSPFCELDTFAPGISFKNILAARDALLEIERLEGMPKKGAANQ